jgi:hypothetical protein
MFDKEWWRILPNLRRSCSSAWKKQMPKRSFLNGISFGCDDIHASVYGTYEILMFALMPRGGSHVILTEFCRIDTGKPSLGIEVSQRR